MVINYQSCQTSFGVKHWGSVESNFGVANGHVVFIIKCNKAFEQVNRK